LIIDNWLLFDYVNNKAIESFNWDKNFGYPIFFDSNTYKTIFWGGNSPNEITCFTGKHEQLDWHYDTHTLGNNNHAYQILSVIAVVSGTLWLDIKPGILLGLNIETGKAKHILKMPSPQSALFDENAYGALYGYNKTVYDSITNKLIGVNWWHYYEVDLNKTEPTIDLHLLKDECIAHKTIVSHSERRCMNNTHIYFADAINTVISALNRKTFKIDWSYRFDGTEANDIGILMKIEVTNDKLYVLDHLGNLFIFQHEQLSN
jgi:outer membrane protein assembly factor BamB